MKFLIALLFVVLIPVVLLVMLLVAITPLLVQRLFTRKSSDSVVYPYLTRWEAEEPVAA